MIIDDVTITVKAGNGGDGAVSFRRNAQTAKGGPDGGNGGNGGSIYVMGSTNISDLSDFQYKKSIRGNDGIAGKKRNLFGKNGEDSIICFPLGTRITDIQTNKTIEIENTNEKILLAKGGKGGRGNNEFKSATNQAPKEFERGEQGEEKTIRLELRFIAQVGLVGYPNVGKSSLLSAISNAKPKIGNYPFTTLDPNLGIAQGIVFADIPGIIAGASKGKGLGLTFLKHIEKTQCLVYCIDITAENPQEIYNILQDEFRAYNPALLTKPDMILFTKCDLLDEGTIQNKIATFSGHTVVRVSIYDKKLIEQFLNEVKKKIA